MATFRRLVLAGAVLLASGCSSASPSPTAPPKAPPKPTAATAASPGASPAASPATAKPAASGDAAASTSSDGSLIRLGDVAYADYGLRKIDGRSSQNVDAGDYYFKGTFLRGDPGQTIKLKIQNPGTELHNISIPSQAVDVDIPVGRQRVEVTVTLPESGAIRFFCKLHADRGMNGQLLAGDAEPQPIAEATFRAPGS